MRNRAKCKLCHSIIESFHSGDYVSCKCDEISVSGADSLNCAAKNWSNFMRVDDEGNEIVVSVKENVKPDKDDLLKMLDEMIKSYENLPSAAMQSPINHYDFASALLLLSEILRARSSCNDTI